MVQSQLMCNSNNNINNYNNNNKICNNNYAWMSGTTHKAW